VSAALHTPLHYIQIMSAAVCSSILFSLYEFSALGFGNQAHRWNKDEFQLTLFIPAGKLPSQ
jgi:hypothetical protein